MQLYTRTTSCPVDRRAPHRRTRNAGSDAMGCMMTCSTLAADGPDLSPSAQLATRAPRHPHAIPHAHAPHECRMLHPAAARPLLRTVRGPHPIIHGVPAQTRLPSSKRPYYCPVRHPRHSLCSMPHGCSNTAPGKTATSPAHLQYSAVRSCRLLLAVYYHRQPRHQGRQRLARGRELGLRGGVIMNVGGSHGQVSLT